MRATCMAHLFIVAEGWEEGGTRCQNEESAVPLSMAESAAMDAWGFGGLAAAHKREEDLPPFEAEVQVQVQVRFISKARLKTARPTKVLYKQLEEKCT